MNGPIPGPSRLPYDPATDTDCIRDVTDVKKLRRRARRRCNCQRSTATASALALASLLPGAIAQSLNDDARLPDRYVRRGGLWVLADHWWLMGRSSDAESTPDLGAGAGGIVGFQAQDNLPASVLSSDTSTPSPTSTPPLRMNVPDAWTPDPRTPFYAVPVIVACSIILALLIVLLIVIIVLLRRRRMKRAEERLQEDPECAESSKSDEKPFTRRGKFASAVRRRTVGLRRRKGKRQMALTKSTLGESALTSSALAEEDLADAVATGSLHTMHSRAADSRSVLSMSSDVAADSDADSTTALTTSAGGSRRPRPRLAGPLPATTAFFAQAPAHRMSAVSLASIDVLPAAPPAYGPSSSSATSTAMSARRQEKQRMAEPEREQDEPPPISSEDEELPQLDRSEFMGHVATDDKAALSRLAEMGSAPEGAELDADMSAPGADEVEAAMLDDALTDDERSITPSAPPSSTLPAPSSAIVPVFTGLVRPQPSAPPTAHPLSVEASAPPLYDPSPPGSEDERDVSGEGEGRARRGHIEV